MTATKKAATDAAAILVLEEALADLRSDRLAVLSLSVVDGESLDISIKLGAGESAIKQAIAQRVEELVTASVPPGGWRSPQANDACPKCGAAGLVRDVGGMDWGCIGCQHQWRPFPPGG